MIKGCLHSAKVYKGAYNKNHKIIKNHYYGKSLYLHTSRACQVWHSRFIFNYDTNGLKFSVKQDVVLIVLMQ